MTVLFEIYDLAVPADESADHLKQAADIKEALENCATGEVDNIAMYNIEAGLKEANRKLLEEIGIEEEAHAK